MKSYDWHNVRGRIREALHFVPRFARHPVRGMRTLPAWDWPTILILQAAGSAMTASLGSVVGRNWILVITSLIVAPVTYLIINAVVTTLFYYAIKLAFSRDVPFRQIYLSSVFASLPGQILLVLSALAPPLAVLGALAWSVLMYVSLTDNFHLPRRRVGYVLGALFVIYAGLSVKQILGVKSHRVHLKERASPEAVDILEKELNHGEPAAD